MLTSKTCQVITSYNDSYWVLGAMTHTEVSDALGLTELKNRTWTIYKCSAKTGDGLEEGMDWLVNTLSGNK